jgi:threonine dehydratase
VLVPVSGGGLISGTAAALKLTMPGVRIVGVEPELAGDASESFRTGERKVWPYEQTHRTIADGLRTNSLGLLPWEHVQAFVDDIITVTEDEIRSTVAVLARRGRLVAEASGAVSTAAYLHHADQLPQGRSIAAVVSGGNVDPALLAELLKT